MKVVDESMKGQLVEAKKSHKRTKILKAGSNCCLPKGPSSSNSDGHLSLVAFTGSTLIHRPKISLDSTIYITYMYMNQKIERKLNEKEKVLFQLNVGASALRVDLGVPRLPSNLSEDGLRVLPD